MKEIEFMEQVSAPFTHFNSSAKVSKNKPYSKNGFETIVPPYNKGKVPYRSTPNWIIDNEIQLQSKKDLNLIATGKAPLGILPQEVLLRSGDERKKIVQELLTIGSLKYEVADPDQQLERWGMPLVDSASITKHLAMSIDERVLGISNPLLEKVKCYLAGLGYTVDYLIDPITNKQYHAGIIRKLNVSSNSSVLHVDDFVRDGMLKPDFRLPTILAGEIYYQISFNLLLEDGDYQADPLFCYNRFYNSSDEDFLLANGWQFDQEVIADTQFLQYQPQVGEAYVFSTTAFHDIYGGSPLSNRITWSVFAIYVPTMNLMLLYN